MTHMDNGRLPLAAVLVCALVCATTALEVRAQSPAPDQEPPQKVLSNEQILQALGQPKAAPTRSLSLPSRGLTRRQASESEQSVNLNIPFELNSSALKPQASEQLKELELALASPSLGNNRFVVAGHTDAKGSAEYNKQLSLRRAETVKRFLVDKGINPARLDTVGYGSEKPLLSDHPEDPSNRRVEIRAIAAAQ